MIDEDKLIEDFGSFAEAARYYKVSVNTLAQLRRKKTKSFKGRSQSFRLKQQLKADGYYTIVTEAA